MFYLKDLSVFLHQSVRSIGRWARKQGLVKHLPLHAGGREGVDYVTRYGAMRIVAHFRALQGEEYLAGKDYHARKDRQTAAKKRQVAKLRCR